MEISIGKIPDRILTRSVRKQIGHHKRIEVLHTKGVSLDASILKVEEGQELVITTNPSIGALSKDAKRALFRVTNNLVVKGAAPIGVLVTLLLPACEKEENLRVYMKNLEQACKELDLELIGGHTEAAVAISQPILSLTGVGMRQTNNDDAGILPSQELVMTRWAGAEGAAILVTDRFEDLRKKYPSDFLEEILDTPEDTSVWEAAKIGYEHHVSAMHDVAGSGVFGALWELAQAYQVGFEVDLKKIPIRQETIEICEFFELNPYLLTARGCLLMVCDHGNEMVQTLERAGIKAAVIGRITQSQDKIIRNDEELRHLEPPREDELYKAFQAGKGVS
ncbi:MAG: hydrogenase expression/formation protein HypE [Clostridiales bacterium]|nr:hydrogenase expression/formation protein HypE [Clostridiales bacterium]